ncbi:MAG: hypothetical protein QXL15_01840, partial [Candidatus Korarchaeota archaeon]
LNDISSNLKRANIVNNIIICEDMRSLILIVAFLHQEDIKTYGYLNLSILKQLQEASHRSYKFKIN